MLLDPALDVAAREPPSSAELESRDLPACCEPIDRARYYAELDAVRLAGDDLTTWLEYSAEGLRQTLERAWLRIQAIRGGAAKKLALRPRQEQLLHLLRDHGSMAPNEIWSALGVSRQGAMDLLRPLLEAGLVEKVGGAKTGHYVLKDARF